VPLEASRRSHRMTFVHVEPVDLNAEPFYLHVDRISSFNDVKLEAFEETVVAINTVYGDKFHIAGKSEDFAEKVRSAIYRFTYFQYVNS
jgi:hypothetical protein